MKLQPTLHNACIAFDDGAGGFGPGKGRLAGSKLFQQDKADRYGRIRLFKQAAEPGEFGLAGDRQAKLLAVYPEIERKGHAARPVGIEPQRKGVKPVPDWQCRRQIGVAPARHG